MKIAVIGMACRYPDASSPEELFQNILAGRRAFRPVPQQRWRKSDYFSEDKKHPDATYCSKMSVIEGFEFNPADFRIPRSTFLATDVAHWLALKVAQEALEDAGIDPLVNEHTAVIIGNTLTGETSRAMGLRYRWPYVSRIFEELLDQLNLPEQLRAPLLRAVELRYKAPFPIVNEDNLAGGLSNTIAGRICNFFDFKAGGFSTDGACSSSLLAINQACIGLEHNTCDLALAGGVDISLDPFELVGFAKVGALSSSDIRVYDKFSDGFLPGEGCGMVVLQRYDDAVAQQRPIYAVINGIGISSDGKGGITAPSIVGQSLAVERAYHSSGYKFSDVELIEGHGTGTPVGDNVELQTFIKALERTGTDTLTRCGIGSIKSNIGHTKAAAGVAGFIKTVMAVGLGVLPPTQGIRTPNDLFKENEVLYPIREGRKWQPRSGSRKAAVSSAGFGGINTHITLSSDIPTDCSRFNDTADTDYLHLVNSSQESEVITLQASSVTGLRQIVQDLLRVASQISMAELTDLAYGCSLRQDEATVRVGFVAGSPEDLLEKLTCCADMLETVGDGKSFRLFDFQRKIYLSSQSHSPRIAFLFPGQGSQAINMLSVLRGRHPSAKDAWDECDQIYNSLTGCPLSALVDFREYESDDAQAAAYKKRLDDTSVAQPAITSASLALVAFLKSLGVRPDVAIGHSLGEYAALCSAGAISLEDTINLVVYRGQAMSSASLQSSGMLSIAAEVETVNEILNRINTDVVVSNINAPYQTVVSGSLPNLVTIQSECTHAGIKSRFLPVSGAFHSKLMAPAGEQLMEILTETGFRRLRHPVISSVSGHFIGDSEDLAQYLVNQVVAPVNFVKAIRAAEQDECEVFVEVGPGNTLTSLTRQILEKEDVMTCSADFGLYGGNSDGLNNLVAYLFACGIPLNLREIYKGRLIKPFRFDYNPKFIESPCEQAVNPLHIEGLAEVFSGNGLNAEALNRIFQSAGFSEQKDQSNIDSASVGSSPSDIFLMIQRYIVKTFGYSEEIVTSTARLQRDLGLDSLKSVEVVFEVMGSYGVRDNVPKLGDADLMTLAEHIHGLTLKARERGISAPSENQEWRDEKWVRAFQFELVSRPLDVVKPEKRSGRVLLVLEQDVDWKQDLQIALQDAGYHVEVAVGYAALSFAKGFIGVVYLANAVDDVHTFTPDKVGSVRRSNRLPLLAGASKIVLADKPVDSTAFFAFITESGGTFGLNVDFDTPDATAGAGFVKSLHLEASDIQVRSIDLNPYLSGNYKSKVIVKEIQTDVPFSEVGYTSEEHRLEPQLRLCDINQLPQDNMSLDSSDVVLISGGAKGITAECVFALATKYRCKLALLGTSERPTSVASDSASDLETNLARLRDAGIAFQYYQCDVSNIESVRSVAKQIQMELGAVTAFVHAAGINRIVKIVDQSTEESLASAEPKIEGLVNLLSVLNIDQCKFVHVFSSVIANSGMAGNSDYAYANEWLNCAIRSLAKLYPHVAFKSFGYSVWDEVGMGARLKSVDLLANMGIDAIPIADGVATYVNLFGKRWPDCNLVISSRLGNLGTIQFSNNTGLQGRFIERITSLQPGVELVAEVDLSPIKDLYLADHQYENSFVFPAVMGMEAMVECAKKCLSAAGFNFKGTAVLEGVQFSHAIIVPVEGRSVRIHVQVREMQEDGGAVVTTSIRSSVTNYTEDYMSATCVWSAHRSEISTKEVSSKNSLPLDVRGMLYGSILFQGPMFQNIQSYAELSSKHCVVVVKASANALVFSNDVVSHSFHIGIPTIRDCYLHAVQVCVPEYKILPIGIEQLEYFADSSTEDVVLCAKERERTHNEFLYDLEVHDLNGICLERIKGFRCRSIAKYEDVNVIKHIKNAMKLEDYSEASIAEPI